MQRREFLAGAVSATMMSAAGRNPLLPLTRLRGPI